MLYIKINPHSGVPVYRQVMDQIRYYVGSGTLKPGARLPSIRELARALAVNPTTVVKAYTELQHAGIIDMKHGKGAFLTDSGGRNGAGKTTTLRMLMGLLRPNRGTARVPGADMWTAPWRQAGLAQLASAGPFRSTRRNAVRAPLSEKNVTA